MPGTAVVAIVGTGLVGRGWAIVFARAGCTVRLWDAGPGQVERAVRGIADELGGLAELGLAGRDPPSAVLGRIAAAPTLEAALDGAVHVQESTPEVLEGKQAVFTQLDAAAGPDAVLASSTSGIPASRFSEALAGRSRCLVAHPLNPPHLIPLVELVPAPWTDPAVLERTRSRMENAGQATVTLKKEVPGFVVNRLQGALLHEAFRLVEDGIAEVDDVDAAVASGLGLRWSFMGPFETIDLNAPGGIADYVTRYGRLYLDLARDGGPPRTWSAGLARILEARRRRQLPADRLGDRVRWRDRRLARLAAHKLQQASERET